MHRRHLRGQCASAVPHIAPANSCRLPSTRLGNFVSGGKEGLRARLSVVLSCRLHSSSYAHVQTCTLSRALLIRLAALSVPDDVIVRGQKRARRSARCAATADTNPGPRPPSAAAPRGVRRTSPHLLPADSRRALQLAELSGRTLPHNDWFNAHGAVGMAACARA